MSNNNEIISDINIEQLKKELQEYKEKAQKRRDYNREYMRKHKYTETQKQYYEKNKETIKSKNKKNYEKNKDKLREINKLKYKLKKQNMNIQEKQIMVETN